MTWNPGDLCSCKPEISKQPVDIFEKDTRVGTGSQGWFCSIVVFFLANFWRGSSLSGFRHELKDTIHVLWGTFLLTLPSEFSTEHPLNRSWGDRETFSWFQLLPVWKYPTISLSMAHKSGKRFHWFWTKLSQHFHMGLNIYFTSHWGPVVIDGSTRNFTVRCVGKNVFVSFPSFRLWGNIGSSGL